MLQLGAKKISHLGLGDAQNRNGYKETLYPWIDQLKEDLEMKDLVSPNESYDANAPSYTLHYIDDNNATAMSVDINTSSPLPPAPMEGLKNNPKKRIAEIVLKQRVTPADYEYETYLIELHCIRGKIKYNSGDVISMIPLNDQTAVDKAITALGWEDVADRRMIIQSNKGIGLDPEWLGEQTLRKLLIQSLDLFGRPNLAFIKSFLSILGPELSEVDRLKLSNHETFLRACFDARRSIFDILRKYPEPVAHLGQKDPARLLDLLPTIEPRSYSIASSPSHGQDPTYIQLLIHIVHYNTAEGESRNGICTQWISSLEVGDRIGIDILKGEMRLPEEDTHPAIFISTGTGIAGMRSFIQERTGLGITENYLFFGYRHPGCDDYFLSEFNQYVEQGQLKLYSAASREFDHKVYIQDRLLEQANLVWNLIKEGQAHIYVSGNANHLPRETRTVLQKIFRSEGGMSEAAAEQYLQELELKGFYQEECC